VKKIKKFYTTVTLKQQTGLSKAVPDMSLPDFTIPIKVECMRKRVRRAAHPTNQVLCTNTHVQAAPPILGFSSACIGELLVSLISW
jgi:hypothetical protein